MDETGKGRSLFMYLKFAHRNNDHFWRPAIHAPAARPEPKPKANIPILIEELTSLQSTAGETTPRISDRSAMTTSVPLDFIASLFISFCP